MAALVAMVGGCSSGSGSQLATSGPMLPGASRSVPNAHSANPKWWQYYYRPSGNHLSRTQASYSQGTASFSFAAAVYTALLISRDQSLTGNLTGDTLTDTVTVSGATSQFVSQNGGSCTPGYPAVRFYFSEPGQFANTHYWWSNQESYTLANGSATLTASLADPSQWSDWNGQSGSSNPTGFYAAVANVRWIGLSYGGGCFFENGATVYSGSALFSSQFTETPS